MPQRRTCSPQLTANIFSWYILHFLRLFFWAHCNSHSLKLARGQVMFGRFSTAKSQAPNRKQEALHEFSRIFTKSENESFVFLQNRADFEEKIGLEEGFVGAVVRPGADEAGFISVAEPVGDLFDGGLFQVVGESGLAGAGRCAGNDPRQRLGVLVFRRYSFMTPLSMSTRRNLSVSAPFSSRVFLIRASASLVFLLFSKQTTRRALLSPSGAAS